MARMDAITMTVKVKVDLRWRDILKLMLLRISRSHIKISVEELINEDRSRSA